MYAPVVCPGGLQQVCCLMIGPVLCTPCDFCSGATPRFCCVLIVSSPSFTRLSLVSYFVYSLYAKHEVVGVSCFVSGESCHPASYCAFCAALCGAGTDVCTPSAFSFSVAKGHFSARTPSRTRRSMRPSKPDSSPSPCGEVCASFVCPPRSQLPCRGSPMFHHASNGSQGSVRLMNLP